VKRKAILRDRGPTRGGVVGARVGDTDRPAGCGRMRALELGCNPRVLCCHRRMRGLANSTCPKRSFLNSCGHTASLPFLVMQTFTWCGAAPWRHECESSPGTILSQNTYPCRKTLGAFCLTPPLTLSQRKPVMSEAYIARVANRSTVAEPRLAARHLTLAPSSSSLPLCSHCKSQRPRCPMLPTAQHRVQGTMVRCAPHRVVRSQSDCGQNARIT
jgi:hypothetical protein